MRKIQCEVCGSPHIKKVDEMIFECQSCGIQYSRDNIKKLLVEVTGEVKIDRSDEKQNMLDSAKRFFESKDYKKTYDLCCDVLTIEPHNCEALLYAGLSWLWQSKSKKINAADANRYFIDAITYKHDEIGENEEFYLFTGMVLGKCVSAFKSAYEWILSVEKKNIEEDLRIDNIGSKVISRATNQYVAEQKWVAAVNEWSQYFGRIYNELISALGKLQLSKFQFGHITFFEGYVDLLEVRYFDSFTGKDDLIEHDKRIIEKFGSKKDIPKVKAFYNKLNGKKLNKNDEKKNGPLTLKSSGEEWMRFCGIMSLTPFTFLAGILVLFFIKKCKRENNGQISKTAKKHLIMGICGFAFWLLLYVIMFITLVFS